MRLLIVGALSVPAFLLGCTPSFQSTPPPPEAYVDSANPHDKSEMILTVVKPACRIIGNYPLDPFEACDRKGRELVAAGRHHREIYVKMCGEIFGFKSSFAYAAYYCFSKAARSSQDRGLQAIEDSCLELHPTAMEDRWLCVEYQTTEVLRRASSTD